ncbi:IclR family transcriptional regulator [Thalassococcus sp. S3]|uniref:IclR family transcriptional regulator n=1 Tax=Thalassococcus sp. S3 TaxID=2017482 RepID=UPI0010245E21|nr:IclR family transcriptional regulator [Thalassococcus sp. S3]QBF30628.1 IclR family transcriptional regulator [Thalassococcus sp. S3]
MGTVAKALSLMTLFSHKRREIGLSEVARLSGLNKATAYRLLTDLQDQGYVEQTQARTYRLGPEVLRLAALREATVPLLAVSREVLDRLANDLHETAHMSLVQGQQLNALAHSYSARHGTRVMMEDSETLSFHATSSGLSVLAFSDPSFVDALLAQPLEAFTERTRTDPALIRAALTEIRASGLAESIGGFEADVHSLAAPLFGPDARPIGALAIAVPLMRMTDALRARIREVLPDAAADLTRRTGGFRPPDFPSIHAA